ncbi:MAG: ABC transporter ATP-binding protein [Actinomycetota bacterium]
MSAISVEGLIKRSGDHVAVDGIDFEIQRGEVYGLLGQNGAGKTTTVEILEGFRERTSGSVRVLDTDPAEADRAFRDRIGVVLQAAGIEKEFSVREIIGLYASSYRAPRSVAEVIEMVELEEKADERVGSLSGGQQRRVDLALGIVGRPEVLFLDEPTTGFDPQARRRAWDVIERLGDDGTTIVLTTHYLDEAEHLADRVGVLAGGTMVAEGPPSQLTAQLGGTVVSWTMPDGADLAVVESVVGPLLDVSPRVSGRRVEATVEAPTVAVHRLTGWAIDAGIELESLSVQRASLEDVFLSLADADARTVDVEIDAVPTGRGGDD